MIFREEKIMRNAKKKSIEYQRDTVAPEDILLKLIITMINFQKL